MPVYIEWGCIPYDLEDLIENFNAMVDEVLDDTPEVVGFDSSKIGRKDQKILFLEKAIEHLKKRKERYENADKTAKDRKRKRG